MISKRGFLKLGTGLAVSAGLHPWAAGSAAQPAHMAGGSFAPNWDSLKNGYKAPDWFRDAKFGIWAHWSAQCVPEAGDWYARNMYIQGTPQYEHHLKTYGHPADKGFMEINNLWKAENWDPGQLLDLYKSAGARYFVALANHHDNFDNYASKFHRWNATRIGPKKDLIAIWAKEARARGLKFGVSSHSAHAFHWFQTAYGYDAEGPRAGERYDAWKLSRHDGKGKWWDGLDPQELYAGALMPIPDGLSSATEARAWHEAHDGAWDENPPLANPTFVREWFLRSKDLLDSYQPDLLYFDDTGLPLGQAGLDIAAHYYNSSLQWHGQLDVVLNGKLLPPERKGALVEDVERGFRADIEPLPWQTDTCIGDWHYNRERFEKKSYVGAQSVINRLCDVVSKNGNLLLSVPLRGDGTIDSEERKIVEEIGVWTSANGDAIFGSRPWRVAGEGPTEVSSGQFGEEKMRPFTAQDIRFTVNKGSLYAMTLGQPSSTVTIRALAQHDVQRVQLAGRQSPLSFKRDSDGLHVALPEGAANTFGVALQINGSGIV